MLVMRIPQLGVLAFPIHPDSMVFTGDALPGKYCSFVPKVFHMSYCFAQGPPSKKSDICITVCFNLCLLCKNPDSDTKWESSGLEITPLQPMHRWSLTYKGKMIAKRTGMSHNVDISVRSRFIQVKLRYQLFYIC